MGIDDDVDVVRAQAGLVEVVKELGVVAVDGLLLFGELVADAGFDEDIFVAGADQEGVQAGGDAVLFVGLDAALPEDFGDDAEEGSAVQVVGAVGDDAEFEVAKSSTPLSAIGCQLEPPFLASVRGLGGFPWRGGGGPGLRGR